MTIPIIGCTTCHHIAVPGAGFIQGPNGPTDQVGFWCKNCGLQISVCRQWSNAEFCNAIFSTINPFVDHFPSQEERAAKAAKPSAAVTGLLQARQLLFTNVDNGVSCPCCDQFAKRYRRKLNSGMARCLIALVRLHHKCGTWVHVREVASFRNGGIVAAASSDGQMAKLRFWSLIEEKPNDDDSKKSSGYWAPTDLGVRFARCRAHVPARVILYNNQCEGFEGDYITIRQALSDKFDYLELMTQEAMASLNLAALGA